MTTRFLYEEVYLLDKQQIKGTQKVSKKALARYYQQQPNRRWLGIPFLLWVHQIGQRSFDEVAIQQRMAQIEAELETEITVAAGDPHKVARLQRKRDRKRKKQEKYLHSGNLLMRWGESPVVYSPQQRAATEQRFLAYLHAKGYFDARVRSVLKRYGRKAAIIYHIEENQPYVLDELRLNTSDKAIEQLLQDHQRASLLKKGDPYDQEVLRLERARIDALLSNHGYSRFDRQYIRFEVDVKAEDHAVAIETVIDMPADGQAHATACIDHVVWNVDADQAAEATPEEGICHYNGITFKNVSHRFKPSLLASKLAFAPLQLYRKQDLIETQRRLHRLDLFKNIHIAYAISDDSKLVPCIDTTLVDRFQLAHELGLRVDNSDGLPKPFYQLSLQGRNLLQGLEILGLAAYVGMEGTAVQTTGRGLVGSQVYGIDLSIAWPQFLLPLKAETHTRLAGLCPVSKFSLDYALTRHSDYTQDTLSSFIRYDWKDRSRGTYSFTPFRVELIHTRHIKDQFKESLKALQRYKTFEPSWISLLSFKGTFRGGSASEVDRSGALLTFFFESGGTLQNFIDLRKIMPQFTYYQYVKFNMGYSHRIPVRPSTIFAYGIHAGIAHAYGREKLLPPSRYYFMGSSNGMRAWLPRSLGPGSYRGSPKSDGSQLQGQFGELLLQGSVELRQQLMGFLEGALFLDAGNIWTLHDHVRLGGRFSLRDFYQEIAIGTGVGLRFNVRLLVLRLDLGFKLYDPARPLGERFVGGQIFSRTPVLSIGIDYPF